MLSSLRPSRQGGAPPLPRGLDQAALFGVLLPAQSLALERLEVPRTDGRSST